MKTLITLSTIFAAGTLAVNAATTLEFGAFGDETVGGNNVQTLSITNSDAFSSTANKTGWEISFDLNYAANASYNAWGSAILATGKNPLANDYTGGFQVFWKNGSTNNGGELFLKYSTDDNKIVSLGTVAYNVDKKLSFVISYVDETKILTASVTDSTSDPGTPATTGSAELSTAISSFSILSSAITKVSGCSISNLSGTVIPEPSMFGLLAGLGALAIAGTRRRRR